jgi:predicted porin
MKKTQVALAALALVASTAAMANVTIYGTLDAAITNTNNGKGTAFDGTGSWTAPSHLGFKGSEDIGGGMILVHSLLVSSCPRSLSPPLLVQLVMVHFL